MAKWKWALALRLPAKVFVINENGDYFWLDRKHLEPIRQTRAPAGGSGRSGRGPYPGACVFFSVYVDVSATLCNGYPYPKSVSQRLTDESHSSERTGRSGEDGTGGGAGAGARAAAGPGADPRRRASTSSTSTSASGCIRPSCRSRWGAKARARWKRSGRRSPKSRPETAWPTP